MNAYERRKRILKLKRDLRQEEKRLAMMEHQHEVMLKFEMAFKDAFGYYPSVRYRHGWYVYGSNSGRIRRLREQDLLFEAQKLYAIKHEKELGGESD